MRAVLSLLAASSLLVSGCIQGEAQPAAGDGLPPPEPPLLADDGRDLRTQLAATDELASPGWRVGDWFGHHVFFGAGDSEGRHYSTRVVRDDGDAWFLATDDKQAAKEEAVFDIPILGPIKKSDMSTTGLGAAWKFYEFPLRDGKTWKHTFDLRFMGDGAKYGLDFTARFNPSIITPDGARPGFDIIGVSKGKTMFEYDYVPDIGWYAHFFLFDIESEDEDDYLFHVMSMGHGSGWKGTYYIDEGKALLESFGGMAVDPAKPTSSFAQPIPYAAFQMDEKGTYLFGFVFVFAFAGVADMILIDPTGKHYEFRAVGAPDQEHAMDIDQPAVAGQWKVLNVAAGAAALHGAFLFQITEKEATLA